MVWCVYALQCRGDGVYIGIASEIAKRIKQHQNGRAALYTKLNPPEYLIAVERMASRLDANRRERKIKHSRDAKESWLRDHRLNPCIPIALVGSLRVLE